MAPKGQPCISRLFSHGAYSQVLQATEALTPHLLRARAISGGDHLHLAGFDLTGGGQLRRILAGRRGPRLGPGGGAWLDQAVSPGLLMFLENPTLVPFAGMFGLELLVN